MDNYKKLVKTVLKYGKLRKNRTGIETLSLFGSNFCHDMQEGLPVLTTKKIYIKGCIHELLWMLHGDTNIKYLVDNNVHIWDEWADSNGDLGPVYGKQWIYSGPNKINQIQYVINEIINNPYSRRIVLDAWSPSELKDMALPPCHVLYQFYAEPDTKQLSLSVYMRSADLFLGVPFDIAEGGILLSLIAKITGYNPNKLIYNFGDIHIYSNHIDLIKMQLLRQCYKLPTLELSYKDNITDYTYNDFNIKNYISHPAIKAQVAI